jgi:hypothetical protein
VRSFYESLAAYAHGRLGPRDFLDAAARDFHVVLEAGNKDGPCTLFRAILALFEDRFGADVSFACQSINQSNKIHASDSSTAQPGRCIRSVCHCVTSGCWDWSLDVSCLRFFMDGRHRSILVYCSLLTETTHLFAFLLVNQRDHNNNCLFFFIITTESKQTKGERLATLHATYLRQFPRCFTPCCRRVHCFRCHIVDFHLGLSCEEYQARSAKVENVVPCPRCSLQLTKGDGCSSVSCPACHHKFSWDTELKKMQGKLAAIFASDFRGTYVQRTKKACNSSVVMSISAPIALLFGQCDAHRLTSAMA